MNPSSPLPVLGLHPGHLQGLYRGDLTHVFSVLYFLGDGASDSLVAHDQLLQLVPQQPVQHGVEALQLRQPEEIPLQLVVKGGAGLEVNPQPDWNLFVQVWVRRD